MKKSLKITIGAALLCGAVALTVWAYSVDYITTAASFTGHTVDFPGPPGTTSGSNATVTSIIQPGDTIPFNVTFALQTPAQSTTFPKTVTFSAATQTKPLGASDVGISGMPVTDKFCATAACITANPGAASTFTHPVTLTAPSTVGTYTVRIGGPTLTSGAGSGSTGLGVGAGLFVTFSVTQPCAAVNTVLSVPDLCVTLHQPATVDLTATLKDASANPLSGQILHFSVDGTDVGDATTNASGVATISNFDVSGLSIGDHQVEVNYDGVACPTVPAYNGANGFGNIGVTYLFIGFEQPINADGSSIFKGGAIPVKIRLSDYNGAPVTDAEAHVFFSQNTNAIVGDEAEPIANTNGDQGNLMRYDPVADQYIFNWDLKTVDNGTYKVWVDLGEGACGQQHNVMLSVAKVGKGVKK
jgi:hypothetical protein